MIKVLLVDDESLALDYLKGIVDWERYGFCLIGATTNAYEAIRLFRTHKPDLVISDVRMPGMDGLDLAEEIRENESSTHILFLSAHKNFDYAKKAIKYRVDDYLIKSDIDEVSFMKKIMHIKESILKEKAKNHYTFSSIIESIFSGKEKEENYIDKLNDSEYFLLMKKYYYCVLKEKLRPSFVDEYLPESKKSSVGHTLLLDICKKENQIDSYEIIAIIEIGRGEYLLVFNSSFSSSSLNKVKTYIHEIVANIGESLNKDGFTHLDVYYYPKRMTISHSKDYYDKNKQQLHLSIFTSKQNILEFVDTTSNLEKPIYIEEPLGSYGELLHAITTCDNRQLDYLVELIKKSIYEKDYISYLWYTKYVFMALKQVENQTSNSITTKSFYLHDNHSEYDLSKPWDMISFIQCKFQELSSRIVQKVYAPAITQSIKFIQENLSDHNLSSAHIADYIKMSSSWFSTKFKDDVGITVSDFINQARVEKAKDLLKNSSYLIYEISEQVGFTSSQYFSKVFKEITGVTPNNFKNNLGGK